MKRTCVLALAVLAGSLSCASDILALDPAKPGYGPFGASNSPFLSRYGRFVLFQSDAPDLAAGELNGSAELFLQDLQSGRIALVSILPSGHQATDWVEPCGVSEDGRFALFRVLTSPAMPRPGGGLFLRDLVQQTTVQVDARTQPLGGEGTPESAVLSPSGRYVVFSSRIDDLVPGDEDGRADLFLWDSANPGLEQVNLRPDGTDTTPERSYAV